MSNITSVQIKKVEAEEGYFVSMPNRRKREGRFEDIGFPLDTPTREFIGEKVLLAYKAATEAKAISRVEKGEVRPDLLKVGEFGFKPKTNP